MLAISVYNNIFYLLHCILIVILFYVRKAQKNHRISSLQSAVFFLFPDGKPFKDGTFFCILSGKETIQHAHIQCFAKSSRTCDQRNVISTFPPLSDKIGFINIKIMIFSKGSKILLSYTNR